MNITNSRLLTVGIVIILASTALAAFFIWTATNSTTAPKAVRVACVGDSLTQFTWYPIDLGQLLGTEGYTVRNFGAGGTTVSLESETPYMNTSQFQDALTFEPDIVIVMLGTNDAQPSLHQYSTSFVDNYLKLVDAFQALPSDPQIWIVLPPPIFDNQSGKISPQYFADTLIPLIEQVADEAGLPVIDVYSAFSDGAQYFPDGVHPDRAGAEIIAQTIYKAITTRNT
jgi:lysophospholipase L1-like esterase